MMNCQQKLEKQLEDTSRQLSKAKDRIHQLELENQGLRNEMKAVCMHLCSYFYA